MHSSLVALKAGLAICLFVCSQQLVVADNYYYYCISDNQQWQCATVEEAGSLPSAKSTGRDKRLFQI